MFGWFWLGEFEGLFIFIVIIIFVVVCFILFFGDLFFIILLIEFIFFFFLFRDRVGEFDLFECIFILIWVFVLFFENGISLDNSVWSELFEKFFWSFFLFGIRFLLLFNILFDVVIFLFILFTLFIFIEFFRNIFCFFFVFVDIEDFESDVEFLYFWEVIFFIVLWDLFERFLVLGIRKVLNNWLSFFWFDFWGNFIFFFLFLVFDCIFLLDIVFLFLIFFFGEGLFKILLLLFVFVKIIKKKWILIIWLVNDYMVKNLIEYG